MSKSKLERRTGIRKRIRTIVKGTASIPRLSVHRSNKQFYAQLIDDQSGSTLIGVSSLKDAKLQKVNKVEQATSLGKQFGELAKKKGIEAICFDRGGYLYHGRVKAFAEAVRQTGVKF